MTGLSSPGPEEDNEIEVGAVGDTLRYWLAKEALRQGELALTSQMTALDAMMSRASSIFGWSVTVTIALVGVASLPASSRLPACASLVCTFLAAVWCVCALWPRNWILNGYDASWVMSQVYNTELELLESMAKGLADGKHLNTVASRRVATFLRLSWLFFCLSPVSGLLTIGGQTFLHLNLQF